MRRACGLAAALFALVQVDADPARGFTQSGGGTAISNTYPMGHEWITRRAAVELLLGNDPIVPADPNDPRRAWTKGLAKNLDLSGPGAQAEVARIKGLGASDSRYQSLYRPVFDSIVGERWVDIGGFNVSNSNLAGNTNCWDAVAQEPAEIQYDHFMRRYDDSGGAGGVQAAQQSQQRFVRYFVDAVMAPRTSMLAWDGGGSTARERVDRNYFLMGRAAHLFQDSFSSEHTVRLPADNHETVRQVKSYLCAYGSEQHSHGSGPVLDYTSGDAIWLPGTQWSGTTWATYKPSFMKTTALVAMEATKDLWAAFIRTMGTPVDQRRAKAEAEAQTLVKNWLSFNSGEMLRWYDDDSHRDATYVLDRGQSGPGRSQATCMQALDVASGRQADKVAELENAQRRCVFNAMPVEGYADLYDPQIHMFYNWQWVSTGWQTPPPGWQIPSRDADTGVRVRMKSQSTQQYMTAPLATNAPVKTVVGTPLDLIMVGPASGTLLRATFDPSLFLSYSGTADGTVKLWNGTQESSFSIAGPAGPGRKAIMNLYWQQYIWVDGSGNVYLTRQGNPVNDNARWTVEGLP